MELKKIKLEVSELESRKLIILRNKFRYWFFEIISDIDKLLLVFNLKI